MLTMVMQMRVTSDTNHRLSFEMETEEEETEGDILKTEANSHIPALCEKSEL